MRRLVRDLWKADPLEKPSKETIRAETCPHRKYMGRQSQRINQTFVAVLFLITIHAPQLLEYWGFIQGTAFMFIITMSAIVFYMILRRG